jgi:hypothetical protein
MKSANHFQRVSKSRTRGFVHPQSIGPNDELDWLSIEIERNSPFLRAVSKISEESDVFWDIKTQFILHRRHITSWYNSQLMICKIRDIHGSDYGEYCLLGYKSPVRTSQETHYVLLQQPINDM